MKTGRKQNTLGAIRNWSHSISISIANGVKSFFVDYILSTLGLSIFHHRLKAPPFNINLSLTYNPKDKKNNKRYGTTNFGPKVEATIKIHFSFIMHLKLKTKEINQYCHPEA